MRVDRDYFIHGLTFAALIFLVSLFGLEWVSPPRLFSPVAPVAGVALSGLFLAGAHFWPWVLVGSILSRYIAHPEISFTTELMVSLIHTLAYLAGAIYLRRQKLNKSLSTLADVRKLIVAAAMVGAISAISPLSQSIHTLHYYPLSFEVLTDVVGSFCGRVTGVLIVAAPFLTFSARSYSASSVLSLWQSGLCLIATAGLTLFVFGPLNGGDPFIWVLFPPLIVSALVGGSALAAQSSLVVATGALWGTTHGFGPFDNQTHGFIILQQFLGVESITGLVLAAALTERREKVAIQQRSEDLRFLSEAAVVLLSSPTLEESVEKIAPGLANRCNADIVMYHDTSYDHRAPPKLVAHYGIELRPLGAPVLPELERALVRTFDKSLCTGVFEGVAHVYDIKGDTGSVAACFCQPIVDRGELLGFLTIASKSRANVDPSELKLLETVAYYITTAATRLRQEERLRDSEIRFRTLADAVPDVVWVSNADGTPEFYNQRWYDFTGEPKSSEVLVPLFELCEPAQRDDVTRRWENCLRSGQHFEIEHRLKHHSGVYRWVLTRALPAQTPDGAIVKWFGTSTDLHDKKVLEAERDSLLESERMSRMGAEQANRVKDDFLAILSHELRNPLNVIVGWAQLLSQAKVESSKAARIIEHSARLQAQLIDDLLDMSRIVSGKITLHRVVVHLSEVIANTVDSMQLVAREKGVLIETHITPHVELRRADVGRITQIVSNLLTNAIKFTPRGGRVVVALVTEDEEAVLTVTDSGEGISSDFLPHIFDRFRQADPSTTRRHGGLGIGLAIARHMASLHGGSISASSPGIGQGATFTVRLPLRYRSDEFSPSAAIRGESEVGAAKENLGGKRIVVVEDDPLALELFNRILTEKGGTVIACSNGAAALDEVRSQRPDVVVSDIGMPDMDGYQLVRCLREMARDGKHLPVIAVTAFARPEDEERALLAGFDAHVAKPVDAERLVHAVVDALGRETRQAA